MTSLVTVFGGTGFLGRRIVDRLTRAGLTVRVAVRHPKRAADVARTWAGRIVPTEADVRDKKTVAVAIAGVDGVVNAVSAYVQKGDVTYTAVHVHGAANVAEACARQGIARLVHISGIGADPDSHSPYIRARGRGESVVRQALPGATILRPSVMFAANDTFLRVLTMIVRSTPIIPLVGGGNARLQPIHVEDVAEAVRLCLQNPDAGGRTYELGGPESYSLRAIIEMIVAKTARRRFLLPVPFRLAHSLARLLEVFPGAPLTVGQVDLLKTDNVPTTCALGVEALGIAPRNLEDTLAEVAAS